MHSRDVKQEGMTRIHTLLALGLSSLALLFSGCQTQMPTSNSNRGYNAPVSQSTATLQSSGADTSSPVSSAPAASTPAPISTTVPVAKASDVIFKSNQIEVTKTVLAQASVGGNLKYRITIKALDDVTIVRVTESIPDGVQFISSDPATNFSSNRADWMFPSMSKGEIQNINIIVQPIAEGDHQLCSTISVENSFCLDVFSG